MTTKKTAPVLHKLKSTDHHEHKDISDDYQKVVDEIHQQLKETQRESEAIEETLVDIEQEEQLLTERYDALEADFQALNNHFAAMQSLPQALQLKTTQDKIATIHQELENTTNAISSLLMNDDNDEKLDKLLDKHHSLHLQVIGLTDMLDTFKGNKTLYDENGVKVKKFEADFILSAEKSLVKDGDLYYLLLPGQDFNLMGQKDKQDAQQRYEKEKKNITQPNKLIQYNRDLGITQQHEKERVTYAHSNALKNTILNLTNLLDSEHMEQTTPTLTLKPTAKIKRSNAQTYRQLLILARTPEAVNEFKKNLMRVNSKTSKALLKELDKIKPGMPIGLETMKSLLRHLERFGVVAYKPNITSIPRPYPKSKDQLSNKKLK